MKRIYLVLALLIVGFGIKAKADEGMWLPHLIQGQTYDEMVRLGVKLTPEQIFDVNNSSLKDAIVRLGPGFCTGEIISDQGLMLTNHHCGFNSIQSLSSPGENNYLVKGFWAKEKKDEMAAGFSVSFLQKIEDVTDEVTEGLTEAMSLKDRSTKIQERMSAIQKEYTDKKTHISAQVKVFFEGNNYYVFIYQTFPDVRLVGTPPQSLGKFGGETDNWMWPRHTCDFSMFRIYADEDNNPAEYSEDNVPYKPKHHLPVSMKGVKDGDFAMIFGYPGSTDRYLTSYGINFSTETEFPARVKVRREKLDIYEKYMSMNEEYKLMYASKYAGVSNYWKNFMGQTRGLKRLKIADRKKAEEDAFNKWANADPTRKALYGNVISLYEEGFSTLHKSKMSQVYIVEEAIIGIEALLYAYRFSALTNPALTDEELTQMADGLKGKVDGHYKDYIKALDQEVCAAMFRHYSDDIPKDQQPVDFLKMVAKYKGDFDKMAAAIYKKSIFADQAKTNSFLNKVNVKKLKKDPMYKMMAMFINHYRQVVVPAVSASNESLSKAKRLYVKGLQEMNANKAYSADANSTMRMTYGSIKDYYPADAVHYDYFTTMDGVLEKYVPGDI
ncbi:MAG: regulator of replication initiation timing, partial [Bacteroidia bacterium]